MLTSLLEDLVVNLDLVAASFGMQQQDRTNAGGDPREPQCRAKEPYAPSVLSAGRTGERWSGLQGGPSVVP